MTGTNKSTDNAAVRGQEVYAETASLAKRLVTQMLLRMIESAASYSNWSLSDADRLQLL